jgi:hypothetical protein
MSIALYRERSATDVINVTFRFLRAHFGPLVKALLLLAGPPLILGSVASMFVAGTSGATASAGAIGLLLLQFVGTAVGGVIAMAVAIGAVQVAHVEGPSALTTGRLWSAVRTHGLSLFGRQIQIGLTIGIGSAVFGGIIGGLAAGMGSSTGGILILVVLGVLFLGFVFYAAPMLTLLLPGQVDANRAVSISRCRTLMKGRWGQTLGVWLLATVITLILFSVGWIPQFVLGALEATGGNAAGSTSRLLAGGVAGVAQVFSPAVTYTAITFQYYNLVEQKEQVSLQEEVDRMEQSASGDTAASESPQAGDEGDGAAVESEGPSSGADSDDDRRWQGDGSDR